MLKRLRSVWFGLFLVIIVSCCSCQFRTTTSIIDEPSKHDFGFTGRWVLKDKRRPELTQYFEIEMGDDATYQLLLHQAEEKSQEWSFRACRTGEPETALVEWIRGVPNAKEGMGHFNYFFASVHDEKLELVAIDGDKLIALIKERKINAVIDRGITFKEITADSKQLRELIIEQRKELSGGVLLTLEPAAEEAD